MNLLKFIAIVAGILVLIGVPVVLYLVNGTDSVIKGEETMGNDIVIPPIDTGRPSEIATATFAMG